MNSVVYTLRTLRRSPRFTLVAIASLALGVGGNVMMYTIIEAALFRPLPFRDPDRLAIVWQTEPGPTASRALTTPADFLDWSTSSTVFDGMAVCQAGSQPVTMIAGGLPERIQTQYATAALFPLLGVQALAGRVFDTTDEQRSDTPAVLSYAFWQRRFGGDPHVIGRTVEIAGSVHTIIGIVPDGFQVANGAGDTDVYRQIDPRSAQLLNRKVHWLLAVGRLKHGVTLEQAQANLSAIAAKLALEFPQTNKGWGVTVEPLRDLGGRSAALRRQLYPLFGAVVVVLLIACTNVVTLLAARAAGRRREIAVRSALGAGRGRIAGQFALEAVAIALLSGLVSVALVAASLAILGRVTPPQFSFVNNAALGLRVFVFTFAISLAVGLAIGLAVSMQLSIPEVQGMLKESSTGVTSSARQRVGSALAVVEIALAFVLVVGAGLLIRTFANLQAVRLGFERQRLVTAQIDLAGPRYARNAPVRETSMVAISPNVAGFYTNALENVRALPGVESAALVSWLPLGGWSAGRRDRTFTIGGQPEPPDSERPRALYTAVSGDYFETLRIPLLRGRYITSRDTESGPWVVVINRAMADRFWPRDNPIGKTLRVDIVAEERSREIVGVVENVHQDSPSVEPAAEMFVSLLQQPPIYPGHGHQNRLRMTLVVRADNAAALAGPLRRAIAALDGKQPIYNIRSMNDVTDRVTAPARFMMVLLGGFAAIAAALAAVGVFALTSVAVVNRTQEFGIRMALGADRTVVLRDVLGRGLVLATLGIVAGLVLSIWLTRALTSLLFGVTALDATTLMLAAAGVVTIGIVSSLQPALRALKVDPILALRGQ